MLDNATDIKIVAIRNDIAELKDQFYIDHPEYVKILNTAYTALDDLVYLKIMKDPQ
jgi:hypothetical protein